MALEKEKYNAYHYGDRLTPGLKLNIEHTVLLIPEKNDLSALVSLPLAELEQKRADSVNAEQAVFERLCSSVAEWEGEAATTALLNDAIEYVKAPAVQHSANQWSVDQNGYTAISNMVYQMSWRVNEETRYDRDKHISIPVAWSLTWGVRTNTPLTGYEYRSAGKIAGQDRKRFTDKAVMEKYLKGRISAYAYLFTELSPPVPPEYAKSFTVNGTLLPGYTVGQNGAPTSSDEPQQRPSTFAILDAAREEQRKGRAVGQEDPAPDKKKRHDEEL